MNRNVPLLIVCLTVCLAGMGTGMFFGYVAGEMLGLAVAGAGGFGAGLLWCLWISATARRDSVMVLLLRGALYGLLVGLADTVLLHGILLAAGYRHPIDPWLMFVVGLVCAGVAGPVVGLLAGGVWALVCPCKRGEALPEGDRA